MSSNRRQFLATCGAALAAEKVVMEQGRWPSTFPALSQQINGYPLTYLDSAATTLRPQSVIDAIAGHYSGSNANPSRVHTRASRAADLLSAARGAVARFVNARDAAEIIFVRDIYSSRNDLDRLAAALQEL